MNERDKIILADFLSPSIQGIIDGLEFLADRKNVLFFFTNDVKEYLKNLEKMFQEVVSNIITSEQAERKFTKLTDEILYKGDTLEQIIAQKTVVKKTKEVFRELVGDWIYKSLIVKRAYKKPRGYPGDYKLLEIVYDNQPLSTDIKDFGYYGDKYFLNNDYAVAVRNRKNKMKELLIKFIKATASPSIEILNLACGSCREIRELLAEEIMIDKKRLAFFCIDQDEEALDFSKNSLAGINKNIKFSFLKANVLDFIRDESFCEKYNFIYSIGLADYLPDVALRKLINFSFNLLEPEGICVTAHKDINKYKPLAPDWFCNWDFYPRNEKDLVCLINSSGISNFKLNLERENSRRVLFFSIKKK